MRQQPGTIAHVRTDRSARAGGVRVSRRHAAAATETEDALSVAVRLYRSPGIARSIRRAPLPRGVILVIRVAAGCPSSSAQAVALTGIDEETIARIAALYLLVALFDQEADAHRILGVAPGSAAGEVQEHRNWLLKWLHPDRNRNASLAGLSVRVLSASAELATLMAQPAPEQLAPPPSAEPVPQAETRPRHRHRRRRWVAIDG